jgi:uncharacterized damage-inducible protein DinB
MLTAVHEPPLTRSSAGLTTLDRLVAEFESLHRAITPEAREIVRVRVEHALDLIRAFTTADVARGRSADAIVRVGRATWSTPDIELGFLCNRIVHIQSLIRQQLRSCGCHIPEGFGSMELQPLRARFSAPPVLALWRLLDELESVIGDLSVDAYCARLDGNVTGSIGEHVRHALDHAAALLTADLADALSYDGRRRGTLVETDPDEALRHIESLKHACVAWSSRPLDEPIRVVSMISPSGDRVTGWSTLARELAFVVSHTIHHQAIIGILLAIQGRLVPERFGHSPSTPRRH